LKRGHGTHGQQHVELRIERAQPRQRLLQPGDVLLEREQAGLEVLVIAQRPPRPGQAGAAVDPAFALSEGEDEHARLRERPP